MDGLRTFDNGYALIIGVGADLPMTVVDATAIRDILVAPERAAYNPQNVTLLTETNATRDSILSAFDELISRVDSDDTVIVYYSGHGGVDRNANEYYLVPFGFKPDDRANTGISAQEFSEKINAINSQKLVVFLDCCHAGGMVIKKDIQDSNLLNYIKSANFQEKAPIDLVNQLQTGSGRFFIASSKENEYSIAAKPYSIFTECLIKALSGAGTVENPEGYANIFEVTGYLLTSVPKRSKDFPPYIESQNPIVTHIANATNFPLCYYSGGNTVKNPLPDAPSPVFTDSQTHNLTIYGVIYEKIGGELRPAVDVKVKIPLKESFTRTNIDGNFLLTDIPKDSQKLDVRWSNGVNLLPIKEDGIYELKKKPYWLYILLIVIGILLVSGMLYVYWDRFFPPPLSYIKIKGKVIDQNQEAVSAKIIIPHTEIVGETNPKSGNFEIDNINIPVETIYIIAFGEKPFEKEVKDKINGFYEINKPEFGKETQPEIISLRWKEDVQNIGCKKEPIQENLLLKSFVLENVNIPAKENYRFGIINTTKFGNGKIKKITYRPEDDRPDGPSEEKRGDTSISVFYIFPLPYPQMNLYICVETDKNGEPFKGINLTTYLSYRKEQF